MLNISREKRWNEMNSKGERKKERDRQWTIKQSNHMWTTIERICSPLEWCLFKDRISKSMIHNKKFSYSFFFLEKKIRNVYFLNVFLLVSWSSIRIHLPVALVHKRTPDISYILSIILFSKKIYMYAYK